MEEYGTTKKKYIFYDLDNLHAKLIVKLMEDGIRHTTLFREFLNAYVNDDPNIRNWIENNPSVRMSKRTINKRKAQYKRIEAEKIKFNLDQIEIDKIFDILADELGD